MGRTENAEKFLLKDPIRNSYPLARIWDNEIYMDDEDEPTAVLIDAGGTVSMRGDKDKLVDLIGELEGGEYRFHAVDPEGFKAAEEALTVEDDHPTWFFKRPSEYFQEPMIEVEELVEEDADEIDKYWGLEGSDSTDYISYRINNAPAYGIRRDGELVAWCLTHYITDHVINLGFLHVKEKWRRKGFAKALTEKLCQIGAERDLVPVVDIFQDNEASISLSDSLGFQRISEHHWFTGIKN